MRNKMPAEYYRKRREAQRAGTFVKRPKSESYNAVRLREQRQAERVAEVDADIPPEVFERGRILTMMMRTHPSQWKPEWTADL